MNLDLGTARRAEIAKYERAYDVETYRMGAKRLEDMRNALNSVDRGSYLDVACGRGESLHFAKSMGFDPCCGTEVVPALIGGSVCYAEAHALPFADNSFDVVTMFDVIEHLLPGDDVRACTELMRVARRCILISANNLPSYSDNGDIYHINMRTYHEWNNFFNDCFYDKAVLLPKGGSPSRMWRVSL